MLPALLFTHGLRPLFSQNSPDRSRQADAGQFRRVQCQGSPLAVEDWFDGRGICRVEVFRESDDWAAKRGRRGLTTVAGRAGMLPAHSNRPWGRGSHDASKAARTD